MATCAFIGHRAIYDLKLYAKVLEAMRALLRLKVREDFLFCPYNAFDYLCLPAAIDLRQHSFPKEARLSLMLEDKECDDTKRDTAPYAVHVPFCLFDRVEAVSTETRSYKANSVNRGLKKVQREALNRATHVFSYAYPELCTPEYQMLLYAQRRGGPDHRPDRTVDYRFPPGRHPQAAGAGAGYPSAQERGPGQERYCQVSGPARSGFSRTDREAGGA